VTSWVWAFLDVPRERWDEACRFWSGATGWELSAPRGEHDQFRTLVPPSGDAWVKLQAVDRPPGVHLDLDSADRDAAAQVSYAAGATSAWTYEDVVVVRSPGGLAHCHTGGGTGRMARPSGPEATVLDQVCLDIPAPLWDAEVDYWRRVAGRSLESGRRPEFATLHPEEPTGGLRLLLQRLDSTVGPVRAHLDLAVADRPRETARHLALGARVQQEREWWTVLTSPDGQVYCLTDRDPATGRVRAVD